MPEPSPEISKIVADLKTGHAALILGPEIFDVDGIAMQRYVRQKIEQQFEDQIAAYYERDGFFIIKNQDDKPEIADLPTTLWTHFKQLDSAEKGAYLLVFDQFEEFFSYPPEQQRAFRDQLADLLSGELPEDLREAARTLDREQRRLLTAPMDIRVLFAIRSDRLHELDRLKDRLPAILHKRYELKALSREQAREAIVGPAMLSVPGFNPTPDPPTCGTGQASPEGEGRRGAHGRVRCGPIYGPLYVSPPLQGRPVPYRRSGGRGWGFTRPAICTANTPW